MKEAGFLVLYFCVANLNREKVFSLLSVVFYKVWFKTLRTDRITVEHARVRLVPEEKTEPIL